MTRRGCSRSNLARQLHTTLPLRGNPEKPRLHTRYWLMPPAQETYMTAACPRLFIARLDSYGEFLTRYPSNGGEVAAFIDSGSNAIFFLDSGTTGIPTCSDSAYSDFYCPNSTLNLSVQLQDTYGSTPVTANFSVANAEGLFAANNYSNVAFDDLGGPSAAPQSGTTDMGTYFDWGLPFHFGRNVFTAIEGQATSSGAGPFVAF